MPELMCRLQHGVKSQMTGDNTNTYLDRVEAVKQFSLEKTILRLSEGYLVSGYTLDFYETSCILDVWQCFNYMIPPTSTGSVT